MTIDIAALRAEFPVLERMAYFVTNGLGSMPRRTREASVAAYDAYLERGFMAHFEYAEVVDGARARAAELLGVKATEIAFCRNTGEGMLWAANAIPWRAGDEVVVPTGEHPCVVYPFQMLERRGLLRVVMPKMEEPIPKARRLTLDVIAGAVTERTRAVALSFVQWDDGFRADLETVGAFCREHDLFLVVDAIQGLGAVPLDARRCQIDFLAAGGHKWMLGTQGTGLFFVREALLDRLVPVHVGHGSVLGADRIASEGVDRSYPAEIRPDAGRFEEGTRNEIGILGQSTSLALLLELGIEQIGARVKALTDALCAGAEEAGCTVLSDRSDGAWSGICLFTPPPGRDAQQIQRDCLHDAILFNVLKANLHLGVHFYNTYEDIDRFLDHLRPPV